MPTKRRIVYVHRNTIFLKPKAILESLERNFGGLNFVNGNSATQRCLNGVKTLHQPNGSEGLLLIIRDKPHFKKNRRRYIRTLEKFTKLFGAVIDTTTQKKQRLSLDLETSQPPSWSGTIEQAVGFSANTAQIPGSTRQPWTRVIYFSDFYYPRAQDMERGALYIQSRHSDIEAYGLYTLDGITTLTGGPAHGISNPSSQS